MCLSTLFVISLLCLIKVDSYPTGPPDSVCVSRLPNHGTNSPQTSECPYVIDAQHWEPGKPTEMVLYGENDRPFKGFLISAQHSETHQLIGSMEATAVGHDPTSQVGQACGGTSLSHKDSIDKVYILFKWTAPADLDPSTLVIFRYTVVQNFTTFWKDCNPFYLTVDEKYLTKPQTTTEKPATTQQTTTQQTTTPSTTKPTTSQPTTTKASTLKPSTIKPTTTEATTTKAATTKPTTTNPTTTKATTTKAITTKATTTEATTTKVTTAKPTTTKASTTKATTMKATTTEPAATTEATTTKAATTEATTTKATTMKPTTTNPTTTKGTTTKATTMKATTMEATTTKTATTEATTSEITTSKPPTTKATTIQYATQTTAGRAATSIGVDVRGDIPTYKPTSETKSSTDSIKVYIPAETTKTAEGKVDLPVDQVQVGYVEKAEELNANVYIPENLKHEVISDTECAEAGNSFIVVPNTDCRKFWQVWSSGQIERSCPGGTKFDSKNCACSWTTNCTV